MEYRKLQSMIIRDYAEHTGMSGKGFTKRNDIMEYLITIHYLEKYLPKRGVVADIGSGPGRYSLWLAQHGYGRLTACGFLKRRKRNIAQWL